MSQRDELKEILHRKGAYCGNCDYETGGCSDCDEVLGIYADAILAAGYVKADREEWGVQSPFGNIRPCSNEGIARLLTTNWSAVRRLVGPWEVA
ncbi:hypothetical protein GS464_24565 [Rhodococcus hoagii]|nr:hypothetical protein [Prescottella equi]